ncbi:hypothetical protein D9758_002777 [Tetrapyrgos nigripes]|uniref:Glycosyltransferase 2-like domain-containing protein n=1 Tax=Tetrapyrgos nigripes TaxID=182062 RepID=A0A8H5GQT3_9AGAR|nr:hypothetical protein D9758_002777 [Tetrapyrgos nigripes]
MDYDRWDAFLHHLFKQTQGDAWFKPDEPITSGVAVRVNDSEFRVFPYENLALEPFETAVTHLNPVVAVKLRNAAVHAALADVGSDETSVYVDGNTRIQVLDTMLMLPHADKEQCAAFIRDERVLVVWSDSLHAIVPACQELERRLIKLLCHPGSVGTPATSSTVGSPSRSVTPGALKGTTPASDSTNNEINPVESDHRSFSFENIETSSGFEVLEALAAEKRRVQLYAPIYNGLAAGLALVFIGNNINTLLREWRLDGSPIRFALVALLPPLYCISLFFAMQIFQSVAMAIGPVAQFHTNSKYYSAVKPRPNKLVDNNLPHITIQMPVYKESLETVLMPSIRSLKRAMQTYARQGGTSSIFINDDGLQLLSAADRNERIAYYAEQNIGWVARPPHSDQPDGFQRAGRFKKASNMNYALSLSLKAEAHLQRLSAELDYDGLSPQNDRFSSDSRKSPGAESRRQDSLKLAGGLDSAEYLEEKALALAIEEVYEASNRKFRPLAANGKAIRLGEIILLVDSDTNIPEDCLRDAAREMYDSPTVAIIQHESDILKVAHHYFENMMAYLTRRITRTISMACANGEIPPFMGHNAFLRWKALQDATFVDPVDGQEKVWAEGTVSEDFELALRLLGKGYDLRWATYSEGEFKEGVSLTVEDERNRWQKYTYGTSSSRLVIDPDSPFEQDVANWSSIRFLDGYAEALSLNNFVSSYGQILRYTTSSQYWVMCHLTVRFLRLVSVPNSDGGDNVDGLAASLTIAVINYVVLGFQLPIDGFYIHNFEVWLATLVVFYGAGNAGYALMEYRLGCKSLATSFLENSVWIPFLYVPPICN